MCVRVCVCVCVCVTVSVCVYRINHEITCKGLPDVKTSVHTNYLSTWIRKT